MKLWQESLASTDVSEMDTDQEAEIQSPNSYSVSSNDFSLSSLEIAPAINNKYTIKQECRSDSSGCGMSSTRVSKENTLVSGINMMIDNNKLCSRLNYDCEEMKPLSSTGKQSFMRDNEYSTRTKDTNKQNNESQKRRSSKKCRRTVIYCLDYVILL